MVWTNEFEPPPTTREDYRVWWGFAGSPLAASNHLILSVGAAGLTLDKRTGEVKWAMGESSQGTLILADGNWVALVETGELAIARANAMAYQPSPRPRSWAADVGRLQRLPRDVYMRATPQVTWFAWNFEDDRNTLIELSDEPVVPLKPKPQGGIARNPIFSEILEFDVVRLAPNPIRSGNWMSSGFNTRDSLPPILEMNLKPKLETLKLNLKRNSYNVTKTSIMNFPIRPIIAALIFTVVVPALAQPQPAAPVRLSKLADRLYEVLDGSGARGGAYLGDQAILLIDTKMDKQSVNQTLSALKQESAKPVKYVINTHSDGDHVNGNQYMPEEVTFIAHENCRQEMLRPTRDGKPSPWNKEELIRCLPSITFRDQMDLFLGSKKVELWYFGTGHTTGDIVVYFPEAKTAFLGDQLFVTRPQLIHAYKGGNSFAHVKTLEKMLAALDATTFCSGHNEPADRNSILEHITQMKAMQEKVRLLVEQGKSLADIKPAFPGNEAALVETVYNEIKR